MVVIVLAVNGWMVFARVTRGIVARAQGDALRRGRRDRAAPAAADLCDTCCRTSPSPLLTLAMLEFARVVLAEASLSFLGLGVQPPAPRGG